LRAELTLEWEVAIPERSVLSSAGVIRRVPKERLPITTAIQLDADAPFVRIAVTGENRTTDVRLRLAFRTGISDPQVYADAAFGPLARRPPEVSADDAAMEAPWRTAPLHRYVSLFDDRNGATIYSDGLAEYEATTEGDTIVTLFRAVGELSRNDLAERPGHAGYPVETPEAQSSGPFEASFAILAHGPRSPEVVATIENTADDVLLPLTGHTWRTAISPEEIIPGLELRGDGLAFACAKESEDGDWVVLRCVNLLDETVAGSWKCSEIGEARLARLDETSLGALAVRDGIVDFHAPPRAAVTVLVRAGVWGWGNGAS
jgi:alpha-mannosidase